MSIGVYIHVPFCVRKCLYCDFTSYPVNREQVSLYLRGLEKEIAYYSESLLLKEKTINTIFVGGGTPTSLMSGQLASILERLDRSFYIANDAEITTEANPGTVNFSYLKDLRAAGFNRLSLGVQSTHQELLNEIGRIHNFEQAKAAVWQARQASFHNINLDLIFGLPKQTVKQWQQSLTEIINLEPQHISCYGLQLEEGTPLTCSIEQGKLEPCQEEDELEMYQLAIRILGSMGYEHYEISNFARPGYQCRHNLLYWHNGEYLGLGPAAHSHLNQVRWGNVGNIEQYASLLKRGDIPREEKTILSVREQMEETVFLGLRMLKGLKLENFRMRFGLPITKVFKKEISRMEQLGLVKLEDGYLKLTEKGLPLANQVFAEFV
ncbi:putative oxygen-independent coproporphyrinogen III oxidase [Desulforamulus reducens MI-1]|uniref:Heme chaperone HemW n=1 Tax=Desulforamulus reducens (strain ATCC BAA-1160 / DSM 100696 / MI-1) TaxID=349161 RepID=A4J7F7_DESRM|nr:radical SAM family heme chaperone HemW [Desulforamulus reducens]ABO51010.1 putative oxygen-independent coproporphyrinogen III oxidase [Desulforamulus reducens MI-1]